MTTTDTRRGFLNGLLIVAGGAAAAALSACSAPSDTRSDGPLPPAGATEVLRAPPGVTYDNVMPDHVAAVRLRETTYVPAWSTTKG